MRPTRPAILQPAILLLLVTACTPHLAERPPPRVLQEPPREAPLRLRFSPPEGRTLEEQARTAVSVSGSAPETVELRLRSTFRREGEGWRLRQEVAHLERGPEGQPAASGARVEAADRAALAAVVRRLPLEAELTRDGTFVRLLTSAEEVERALREAVPDAARRERLRPLLERDGLEARMRAEWDGRYGQLLQRPLRTGDTLYSVESVAAGGAGALGFLLARTVVGLQSDARGEAVVLAFRCHGSTEGLPADVVGPLLRAAGDPPLEPSVACEGEQRVEAGGVFLPLSTRLAVTARRPVGTGTGDVRVERTVALRGTEPTGAPRR